MKRLLPVVAGAVGRAIAAGALTITAAGLTFAAATPAWSAGSAATITFSTPASDGATLTTNPITVAGNVTRDSGIVDSIDVVVRWTDTVANRPPSQHPTQETTISPPTRGPSYDWSFPLSPGPNGQYTATVNATTDDGNGSSSTTTASRSFIQDVAPATPTGLKATTDNSKRVVNLSWQANTEPDLIGYEVQRAGPQNDAPFKTLYGVQAPATTYTDNQVATQPAGTYRYQIIAVRPSGDGTKADVSQPSATASGSFTSPPRSAPAPTTTTAAPQPTQQRGTTSKGHSTSTAGKSGSAPALAPVGRSLPSYQALLNQAAQTTATTEPPDPGYKPNLPYAPQTSRQAITLPGGLNQSGSLGSGDGSSTLHQTAEFVAAALVLAVLAMFAWVLRGSADQAEALEALAPAAPAAAEAAQHPLPPPAVLPTPAPASVDEVVALMPLLITIHARSAERVPAGATV